jgi:hypothetical protein
LQPNANINVEHVNKVLGCKVKSHAEKEEIVKQWTSWKKEVRGWASHHIKEKMYQQAQRLENNEETLQPTLNGKKIQKFQELTKWWSLSNPTCTNLEATFAYLAYDMWEKGWEKQWENNFMTTYRWYYDPKVKENIRNTCERQGYEMKGCVAKNIKQVKGEIVKGMQKQGQTNGHGKTMKKHRDRSEAYTEDKKYIRSKKVTITVIPKEDVDMDKMLSAESKAAESNCENKKDSVHGNNNEEKVTRTDGGDVSVTLTIIPKEDVNMDKKLSAETKAAESNCDNKKDSVGGNNNEEEVTHTDGGDVSVTEIDGHIILAANSPEKLERKKKEEEPSTPPCQTSAYELEREAKIKRINDNFNAKYPKLTVQKTPDKKRQPKVSYTMNRLLTHLIDTIY